MPNKVTDGTILNPSQIDNSYRTKRVNIEFSSACNLRCAWCNLDHSRECTFITPRILNKVMQDLINQEFYLNQLCLFNGGETLLNPNILELLSIIGTSKNNLKGTPEVVLATNATMLSKSMAHLLIDTGAITYIRFSVDGGTESLYRKIRKGANWQTVRENIRYFVELNNSLSHPVKTGLICIVPTNKPLETGWMQSDFKELFNGLDVLDVRHPHNWDGSTELGIDTSEVDKIDALNNGKLCSFLDKNLVVLANGDVSICCADLNGRGVLGNILTDSLENIYSSEKRMAMINNYINGRRDQIDLCKDCAGYY